MSRNIHFGYKNFVSDQQRFEESKNYNSPESLLVPSHWSGILDETIYFNQDTKKLKSLQRYFCNSDNAIDYKNKFANNFLKQYINGIKKPIWLEFLNSKNKIDTLQGLIKTFDTYNKRANQILHNINIDESSNNFILKIFRKDNIEEIQFNKDNNIHLLTLFILLENTNECSPLILLNYEIKGRLLIEELLLDKTYLLSIIQKFYNCANLEKYDQFFIENNSIFTSWGTSFTGRLDPMMRTNSFDDFYINFFEEFLGSLNKKNSRSGNQNFFDNINDPANLYNYSNIENYYLTMGDIDSGMNYLRLGDLIYYNYLALNKYNFISGIIYGFGHELAHHIATYFLGEKCDQINSNFIKDTGEKINGFVAGNAMIGREKIDGKWKEIKKDIEGEADIISYYIHLKILEDHFQTLPLTTKKEMVKNIFNLSCGDRTNNSHADTMIRSMYIRFIPEFDQYLPQDNANYIKYMKYKNKYLTLKKNLNKL